MKIPRPIRDRLPRWLWGPIASPIMHALIVCTPAWIGSRVHPWGVWIGAPLLGLYWIREMEQVKKKQRGWTLDNVLDVAVPTLALAALIILQ